MLSIFHYTDRTGWNGIRSQPVWRFRARQPPSPNRPFGVYFTDIEPSPANLRTLCKRLRVPRAKREYVFSFRGTDGLSQLHEGKGRDRHIYFSAADYEVVPERQQYNGLTEEVPL